MSELSFGNAALEKLSSPEQLDQLMQVTSPRDWIAVATLIGLLVALSTWMLLGTLPTTVQGSGILMRKGSVHRVLADDPGKLMQFLVGYGSRVTAGQVVARVQTSPTSLEEIKSLYSGVVVKKAADEGDFVASGATLLVMEPDDTTLEVIVYMPLLQGKAVRPGMSVQVSPSTAPREVYGFLLGTVRRVSAFPSVEAGMLDTLGNEELVKYFLGSGSAAQVIPLEIRVDLVPDATTASGYAWSSSRGPALQLTAETLVTTTIVLSSQHPISLLIPETGP